MKGPDAGTAGVYNRAYPEQPARDGGHVTARSAYTWGLARKEAAYKATGTSLSAMDLHRELNALKQTALPWMYAVSKCAPHEALRHLDRAFAHFFRRCKLTQDGKLNGTLGYPQRQTKKQGLGSFRLTGSMVIFPDAIQLPRLGRLRLKECGYLPGAGVKGAPQPFLSGLGAGTCLSRWSRTGRFPPTLAPPWASISV